MTLPVLGDLKETRHECCRSRRHRPLLPRPLQVSELLHVVWCRAGPSWGRPLSGPVTLRLVGTGLSARRLLPGEPVHRLPEEVGMAVVPRVLLDQVDQDP